MNAIERDIRPKIIVGVVLVVLALGGAVFGVWYSVQARLNSTEMLLSRAEMALEAKDYATARDMAERSLRGASDNTAALVTAGKAAVAQNDLEGALGYFGQVSSGSSPDAVEALMAAGELAYNLGRPAEAEKHFRAVLAGEQGHKLANGMLAYLLNLEGRSFEAAPYHYFPLKTRGEAPLETLSLLAGVEPVVDNRKQMDLFLAKSPADNAPLIAKARVAMTEQKLLEARRLLERIVQESPELIEAQARYGELLLTEAPEKLADWNARLPKEAEGHPVVWLVRGQVAERDGQTQAAARCYWRAVQLDPTHAASTYRLGQVLKSLGRPEAEAITIRAAALQELGTLTDDIRRSPPRPGDVAGLARIERAATLTEQLGRLWEACAWADTAVKTDPSSADWAKSMLARLMPRLDPKMPRTTDDANPGRTLNLSEYPLPSIGPLPNGGAPEADPKTSATQSSSAASMAITYEDRAESAGLKFRYDNDDQPGDGETRLIETTGGGVGALDFDADGWPDLYFTQGCDWPTQGAASLASTEGPAAEDPKKLVDKLFRNIGGEQFHDATLSAGLGDEDYSQGVSVGDFDNDGFADLYVANLGQNRLYHNLGDGRFVEVSAKIVTAEHFWTTSCLLADVSGDGLPDLFDVNYVANRDLNRAVCSRGNEVGGCRPGAFEAAQDRLLLNQGDGSFVDVSESAGIFRRDGMGLGIVAADFHGAGRTELFVANDGFPNYFFSPTEDSTADALAFQDDAAWNGLAVDYLGKAQACMGVAAGDANLDGRLDLYVTNFYNESNTLYLQRGDGLFEDATGPSGLREPSMALLGFGCQFIDGDLDGAEDLIVTNGHVFDMSYRGVPYAMRAQFFRNRGDGQFDELHAETAGEFFRDSRLGRGLARIDWNRDGRDDAAMSHLDAPAALLTNVSPLAARSLALHLHGVESNRDAIGAVVTVTVGGRKLVRQMSAGDGYHASNERRLTFGLGNHQAIEKLEVRWPSGRQQSFDNPPPVAELACVEGSPQLAALAR